MATTLIRPTSAAPVLSRKQKLAQQRMQLRAGLWPSVGLDMTWNRKTSIGFATIPRTLPLMSVIMDTLSVGKPVSSVYFELWTRVFDEGFVKLEQPSEMAFAAGFITDRRAHIWAERIDILNRLGFIELAPGANGPRSFALIYNPYHVIKRLRDEGKLASKEGTGLYNALLAQAISIGATDLDPAPETPAPQPEPAAQSLRRPFRRGSNHISPNHNPPPRPPKRAAVRP